MFIPFFLNPTIPKPLFQTLTIKYVHPFFLKPYHSQTLGHSLPSNVKGNSSTPEGLYWAKHKTNKTRFYYQIHKPATLRRSGSRAAAASKMECFVIIVKGWKPLTIITKHSILNVAAALDPTLLYATPNESFRKRTIT